jgi:ATP-dependent DNA ligase
VIAGTPWEIKLDGARVEAQKGTGRVTLYTRAKIFNAQFYSVIDTLEYLPDETLIGSETVAVDASVLQG